MLLRFGVANHRSIRDYQELYLSASKRIKRKGLAIPVPILKEHAVPIVAIYGANAAGNQILLTPWARSSERSFDLTIIGRHGPYSPDPRFDSTTWAARDRRDSTARSRWERGVRRSADPRALESVYEYGFEYTETEFRSEWLYRVVRKERQSTQVLFERKTEDSRVRISFWQSTSRREQDNCEPDAPKQLVSVCRRSEQSSRSSLICIVTSQSIGRLS